MRVLPLGIAKTTHRQFDQRRVGTAYEQHIFALCVIEYFVAVIGFQNVAHLGGAFSCLAAKQTVIRFLAHFAHHSVENCLVSFVGLAPQVCPLTLVLTKQSVSLTVDFRPYQHPGRLDRLTLVLKRRPYHVAYIRHLKYAL